MSQMNRPMRRNLGAVAADGIAARPEARAALNALAPVPVNLVTLTNQQLLALWQTQTNRGGRDRILKELQARNLFPSMDIQRDEEAAGLFPDVSDDDFIAKLLAKTEFSDTMSHKEENKDPCAGGMSFEVTPVQRFVANFLAPRTPYMSMLLYHGVGVGKTCAAIQAAETYLQAYPRRKVLIVCPRAIRGGFYRTIFDTSEERLQLGTMDTEPNEANGCTGNTYLNLAGMLYERNREVIERRVKRAIESRYEFYGYGQFANHIRNVLRRVPRYGNSNDQRQAEIDALRREFSYRMLIIDEAHNLRDVTGSTEKEEGEEEKVEVADATEEKEEIVADLEERKEAKMLTPFLERLLRESEGMKLLLMSATPMFNSVFEIVHIFNLMLMNDKQGLISESDILDSDGMLKKDDTNPNKLAPEVEEILKPLANKYVSFMRGENPNSFPLRLFPEGPQRMQEDMVPLHTLNREFSPVLIDDETRKDLSRLPIVVSAAPPGSASAAVVSPLTRSLISKQGVGYKTVDTLLQANNCVYPVPAAADLNVETLSQYIGIAGFTRTFDELPRGRVRSKVAADWLAMNNFGQYSPKGATILQSLRSMIGVGFVYSRFIKNGALLLALALEANGYTPYGIPTGFLDNGIQTRGRRQCALCEHREEGHPSEDVAGHKFVAAKYVLLTGNKSYSPNNQEAIRVARSAKNRDGRVIKVILGSQIASEGVDLRFIREIHVMDPWFHLNKTEQIVGRGIRFCSHSLLPLAQRNTTIFLHALTLPDQSWESADLYTYRVALRKAIQMGEMSRQLKVFAIDCNLRKEVTVLKGLGDREQITSQGQRVEVSLDDTDYTAMCDWMECKYTCDPDLDVSTLPSDDSTYDALSAQYRESQLQTSIRKLFAKSPFYDETKLRDVLYRKRPGGEEISDLAVDFTLQGIINNPNFRVKSGSREGYIIYKNKYFIFQPDAYRDKRIPMALRIAAWPVKQDQFTPATLETRAEQTVGEEEAEAAEAGAVKQGDEDVFMISAPGLWKAINKWVTNVFASVETFQAHAKPKLSTDDEVIIAGELLGFIEQATSGNKKKRSIYMTQLKIIIYLASLLTNKDVFRKVVLEYFWDTWIQQADQVQLLFADDEDVRGINPEQVVVSGSVRAIRIVNVRSGQLEYYCEPKNLCSERIQEAFESIGPAGDAAKAKSAEIGMAGNLYGFLVPKCGIVVFKTQEPHTVGEKPDRGQECSITTARSKYVEKIRLLGQIFESQGVHDLTESLIDKMDSKESMMNSVTAGCMTIQLLLRYMNTLRMGGLTWFFRPVEAKYSGHSGAPCEGSTFKAKPVPKSAGRPKTAAGAKTQAVPEDEAQAAREAAAREAEAEAQAAAQAAEAAAQAAREAAAREAEAEAARQAIITEQRTIAEQMAQEAMLYEQQKAQAQAAELEAAQAQAQAAAAGGGAEATGGPVVAAKKPTAKPVGKSVGKTKKVVLETQNNM
jgi:hypothetical protein